MEQTGFLLPPLGTGETERCGPDSDGEADAAAAADPAPSPGGSAAMVPRSAAVLEAARRLLGFEAGTEVSVQQAEEAFRNAVRAVHPDRVQLQCVAAESDPAAVEGGGGAGGGGRGLAARSQGWAVAQLTWARKVLREAALLGSVAEEVNEQAVLLGGVAEEVNEQETPAVGELLMLADPE